jgi:DNA-dependent protein kinase catalytic subunit
MSIVSNWFAAGRTQADYYYAMFQHASRAEAVKQASKQQATIPGDILRRGIRALSASPEAFLALRAQFARTLAVFNISSYIIGIGDRHLENFLLSFTE